MPTELILRGDVQGVFCREFCGRIGNKLGVRGAASNLRDGTVRVLLDSEDPALLDKFITQLKTNPYGFRFFGKISDVSISPFQGEMRGDRVF